MTSSIVIPALQYGAVGLALGSVTTFIFRRTLERILIVVRYTSASPTKMALVVRTDIPMTSGKVATQCSHAAVSCFSGVLHTQPTLAEFWGATGQQKVVLRCTGEMALQKLQTEAEKRNLVSVIITDAGRTQIPKGTKTVIGIGPGSVDTIDEVTGNLKLF